jgi:glutaredoxin
MFAVIFGRPGCPYCVRAKELAEKLTEERDDFNFRYVDIHAEGITKADLEKLSVNRLKPYRRFSSIRNTLAAAPILKLTPKNIWACLLPSNAKTPSP